MTRKIPFFNYPGVFLQHEEAYKTIVMDVLNRGAYIMQKDLAQFEKNLATYLNVKHAIGVGDGTMALVVALKAVGLEAGDEVLVPSHTFVASAAAVHHAGGTPVLVDVGEDHLMDAKSVEASITGKTRGIMPVHLNGRTCNMGQLQRIAEQHGLFIVEDAAQALGSKYKTGFAGTFGMAGTFSFYPAKTLGCFGDGGAVVTNDDSMAEKVRLYRDHGRDEAGQTVLWGYNSRLDNLQAAILDKKLSQYDQEIEIRRTLAGIYDRRLSHLTQLALPPGPGKDPERFDVFQNYEIQADRRDQLMEFLERAGVSTIKQFGGAAIHQFQKLGFDTHLPNADRLVERYLLLPMNTSLSTDDVEYVCDKIFEFFA